MLPENFNKLIWFKKAKCAGTSFESLLQDIGAIYYVNHKTTISELEDPANKVICIREALFPYGKTPVKKGDGKYHLEDSSLFIFRLRRALGIPFLPKLYMEERFPEFLSRHPKFAIARNPYDKFISSWKYLKKLREKPLEYVLEHLPSRRDFHDWVHITQLQTACIEDRSGNLLVDHIVYMEEEFDVQINAILSSLGMPQLDMPRENRSVRNKYSDYLNEDTAQKIYSIYKKDFKVFRYSKDYLIDYPVK